MPKKMPTAIEKRMPEAQTRASPVLEDKMVEKMVLTLKGLPKYYPDNAADYA